MTVDLSADLAEALKEMIDLYERATKEDQNAHLVSAYRRAVRALERYEVQR